MIKNTVSITVSIILLSLSNSFGQNYDQVLGQELNAITTSVPFLMIAPDSRAGAMGDAGVATSPDGYSQRWNSSKLAFIDKGAGLTVSYTPSITRSLIPLRRIIKPRVFKYLCRKSRIMNYKFKLCIICYIQISLSFC